jgi:hypothetical protein
VNREVIGVSAARRQPGDPVLEAATLVGQELWDTTRAQLFEGESVSVLMSSRRGRVTDTSDVWVTVLARATAIDDGGPVAVTLTGIDGSRTERLDARGCCVIRDVPDGRYHIEMSRQPGPDRAGGAALLILPVELD